MRVSGEDLCVWRGREVGGGWVDRVGGGFARGRARMVRDRKGTAYPREAASPVPSQTRRRVVTWSTPGSPATSSPMWMDAGRASATVSPSGKQDVGGMDAGQRRRPLRLAGKGGRRWLGRSRRGRLRAGAGAHPLRRRRVRRRRRAQRTVGFHLSSCFVRVRSSRARGGARSARLASPAFTF